MPGLQEFGEVAYTLTDCLIAAYNKVANTYGTPVALFSGQMVEVEPEHDTDQLRGYGVKTALLSVAVGAKIKLGAGGLDFSAHAILTGADNTTSGSDPNQVRRTMRPAGGAGLPYFGLMGVAATDDNGVAVVGLQCVKLNTYPKFTLDGKENKFNLSEAEGYAIPVAVSSALKLDHIKVYQAPSLWVAPTTGANFLAFFTTAGQP